MGFFRIFESELNNIVQLVAKTNEATSSKMTEQEAEKLLELLNNNKNNKPAVDITQKKPVSDRVKEQEVQDAISYFNNCSKEERISILEKADSILETKLMAFMETNSKYTDDIDGTSYLLRQVLEKTEATVNRKTYTDRELAAITRDYQRLFANASIQADRVQKAFMEYRGNGSVNSGKICEGNKDEFAISQCSKFKQAINSYNKVFVSNVQEVLKATESSKPDFMNNLARTVEKTQSEIEHFQNTARDLMNAFIPDAVSEENKFSKNIVNYAEKGIPSDFYLQNKVVENAIIYALVDASTSASITDAA